MLEAILDVEVTSWYDHPAEPQHGMERNTGVDEVSVYYGDTLITSIGQLEQLIIEGLQKELLESMDEEERRPFHGGDSQ